MARPKANPRMRFMDEIDIWAKAYATYQTQGQSLTLTLPTVNAAIALNHRLNMARATIRATEGTDGWHNWDELAIYRKENRLIINIKRTIFDTATITVGDEIITKEEIIAAKYKSEEANRKAMEHFNKVRHKPAIDQPKLDGQGHPIRGNEDVPDPAKSLIDC